MATTVEDIREERVAEAAARLRLAITRTARRLRQEAGGDLSPTQAAALATIDRHGPVTPSEIAAHERIQRPTATRIVARLEQDGLIERAADPADRRSSLVTASAAGRDLLRRLRGRKTAYLARRLRQLEAEEDLATLERAAELLERMLESDRKPPAAASPPYQPHASQSGLRPSAPRQQ